MGSSLNLVVYGASGRVGTEILKYLEEFPCFTLGAALVSEKSKALGARDSRSDIKYSSNIEQALHKADCVIDFSTASASKSLLQDLLKDPKATVIGTTGHDQENLNLVKELSKRAPILLASNTSIGIVVLEEVSKLAQKILGPSFDVEIVETHRRGKIDAPSGTALTLAQALAEKDLIKTDRNTARGPGEVTIQSLRGGDVAGEHTIHFLGESERLEFTHTVSNRAVFARGALRLASLLHGRKAGLYAPRDLFESIYSLM